MTAQGWNVDIPTAEYYGPVPFAWQGRVPSYDLEPLVREIADTKRTAIDTETTGLIVWKDIPLYWSLAWGNRRATLHHSLLPYFSHIFRDPYKDWVLANAKYDTHILANVGLVLQGNLVDTQVGHSLLYEEQPHNLKYMAKTCLGWRWSDFQDTFGKITKNFGPAALIEKAEVENFPLLIEYAANDAWGTLAVGDHLEKELAGQRTHSLFSRVHPYIETLHDLFRKVEVPYTKVLWKNERNGIQVDRQYLEGLRPVAEAELRKLEQDIAQQAGGLINPKSTAQLKAWLIDREGLQPLKMTKGGKTGQRSPSVDSAFLEHHAELGHKGCQLLTEHRTISKLHGTYIVGLTEFLDPTDRIHPRSNQDIVRTGRLSYSEPNLQQVPNPEGDRYKLRKAFIAKPGRKLIVSDYKQLEMRLLAAAAMEPDMIDIFLKDRDIHMGNASFVYGIPYDEMVAAKDIDKQVKKGELHESAMTARVKQCLKARYDIKAVGFGLNYGMGANKLARTLGVSIEEAHKTINQYMGAYPAVKQFYQEAIEETERTGYAFTIIGRRRNVPEITSRNKGERSRAERIAVNLQIQGSGADVVKMAQIYLDKCDLESRYDCYALLNVHDELVFDAPDENVAACTEYIRDGMEHPFVQDLMVPLLVDIGHGQNWLEAK